MYEGITKLREFILIDFSWLYNKYYYVAKYSILKDKEQKLEDILEENLYRMLFQFLSLVKKSYLDSKIILALDSPTKCLNNYKIYEEYKQNRNSEEKKEVYSYLDNILKRLIKNLDSKSFAFVKEKLHESDQILAFIAKKYHEKNKIIIYSGDKDLLQLSAFSNVYISEKFEKGNFIVKTDKEIFEKFKNSKGESFTRISTNKRDILKYRSLKGDSSDNLSPIFPRIKDKDIVEIIKNYWVDDQEEELTEERINKIIEDDLQYENPSLAEKLRQNKDVWLRNYKIMDLLHVDDIIMKRVRYK